MKKQIIMLVLFSINSMAMQTLLQPTSSSWCAQGGKWSPQSHQGKSMLYFYNNTAPYYEFTNFYAPTGGITIDGKVWPTTEHYYQAMKFNDDALQEAVRNLPTPRAAFDFTKTAQNSPKVRSDWSTVNLDIMRKAVLEKFSNDPVLKKLLLSTGDAVLVEDAGPKDAFYGAGADCNGFNWLGNILMETRETLKLSAKSSPAQGTSESASESVKNTSDQSEMNRRITRQFNQALLEDPTILPYEKITEKWDGMRDEARKYLGTFGSDKMILNIRIITEGLGSVPTVEGKLAIKGDQNANDYYRKIRNSEVEKANKLIDEERYTRAIELLRPFTPDTSAKIIKTYIKMINYLAESSKRSAREQAAEALDYAKSLEVEIRSFGDIPAQFKAEKAALEALYNSLK